MKWETESKRNIVTRNTRFWSIVENFDVGNGTAGAGVAALMFWPTMSLCSGATVYYLTEPRLRPWYVLYYYNIRYKFWLQLNRTSTSLNCIKEYTAVDNIENAQTELDLWRQLFSKFSQHGKGHLSRSHTSSFFSD